MGGHSMLPLKIPKIDIPQVSYKIIPPDPPPQAFTSSDQSTKNLKNYGYYPDKPCELPSSYIRWTQPTEDQLERRCEYDMDEQDLEWLQALNADRKKMGHESVTHEFFEIAMDRLEKEWFRLNQRLQKPDPNMIPSEDSRCVICEDGDTENSNAIVFCDGCNLAVHQDCYGVPYIPEGQWLCRKCTVSPDRPVASFPSVACELCPNSFGAFKQTAENKWAHLVCAIHIPETGVGNAMYMEPIDGVRCIPKQRWKLKCYICKKNVGACVQCANRSCCVAYHVTCAQESGLYVKMRPAASLHRTSNSRDVADGLESHSVDPAGAETIRLSQSFCDKHTPKEHIEALQATAQARLAASDAGTAAESNATIHPSDPSSSKCVINSSDQLHLLMPQKKILSLNDLRALKVLAAGSQTFKSARAYRKSYSSGPPLVPEFIFQRTIEYTSKLRCYQKKSVLNMICKYWSLKREIRRGAPLLKRLHLEPWTAANLSNCNNEEDRRRKFGLLVGIRLDLEKVKNIAAMICKREKIKLRKAELQKEVIEKAIFPVYPRMSYVLNELIDIDKHKYFMHPVAAAEVPDYYDVIKRPMNWVAIRRKIDRYEYCELYEFISDIYLTLTNARLYNHVSSTYHKAAIRIGKAIEPLLHDLIATEPPSAIAGLSSKSFPTHQQRHHFREIPSILFADRITDLLDEPTATDSTPRTYEQILQYRNLKISQQTPSLTKLLSPAKPPPITYSEPNCLARSHLTPQASSSVAPCRLEAITPITSDPQTLSAEKDVALGSNARKRLRKAKGRTATENSDSTTERPAKRATTRIKPESQVSEEASNTQQTPQITKEQLISLKLRAFHAKQIAAREVGMSEAEKARRERTREQVRRRRHLASQAKLLANNSASLENVSADQVNLSSSKTNDSCRLDTKNVSTLPPRNSPESEIMALDECDSINANLSKASPKGTSTPFDQDVTMSATSPPASCTLATDPILRPMSQHQKEKPIHNEPQQVASFSNQYGPLQPIWSPDTGLPTSDVETPAAIAELDTLELSAVHQLDNPNVKLGNHTQTLFSLSEADRITAQEVAIPVNLLDRSSIDNSSHQTESVSETFKTDHHHQEEEVNDIINDQSCCTSVSPKFGMLPTPGKHTTPLRGSAITSASLHQISVDPCARDSPLLLFPDHVGLNSKIVEHASAFTTSSQSQATIGNINGQPEEVQVMDDTTSNNQRICVKQPKAFLPVDPLRPSKQIDQDGTSGDGHQQDCSPLVTATWQDALSNAISPDSHISTLTKTTAAIDTAEVTEPEADSDVPVQQSERDSVNHSNKATQSPKETLATVGKFSNVNNIDHDSIGEEHQSGDQPICASVASLEKKPIKMKIRLKNWNSSSISSQPQPLTSSRYIEGPIPGPELTSASPKLRLILENYSPDKSVAASAARQPQGSCSTSPPQLLEEETCRSDREKSKAQVSKNVAGYVGPPEFVNALPGDKDSFRLFNTRFILPEGASRRHPNAAASAADQPDLPSRESIYSRSNRPESASSMMKLRSLGGTDNACIRSNPQTLKPVRLTLIHNPPPHHDSPQQASSPLASTSMSASSEVVSNPDQNHIPKEVGNGSSFNFRRTESRAASKNLNQTNSPPNHSLRSDRRGSKLPNKSVKRPTKGLREDELEKDALGFFIYPKAVQNSSKNNPVHPLAREAFRQLSLFTRVPEEGDIPDGTLVWAKVPGHNWFPAEVGLPDHPQVPQSVLEKQFSSKVENHLLVMFFDHQRSWQWVARRNTRYFGESDKLDALLCSDAYVVNKSKLEEIQSGCAFARANIAPPEDIAAEDERRQTLSAKQESSSSDHSSSHDEFMEESDNMYQNDNQEYQSATQNLLNHQSINPFGQTSPIFERRQTRSRLRAAALNNITFL